MDFCQWSLCIPNGLDDIKLRREILVPYLEGKFDSKEDALLSLYSTIDVFRDALLNQLSTYCIDNDLKMRTPQSLQAALDSLPGLNIEKTIKYYLN